VIPHFRDDDDEHVGYLQPAGELFVPVTLIRTPLAEAMPKDEAIARLDERGLAELDERWWARLPAPLSTDLDATRPAHTWEWRAVRLIEVRPDAVVLRLDYATVDEFMAVVSLPNPPGNLLRREQP
jgi:hypothetical protein